MPTSPAPEHPHEPFCMLPAPRSQGGGLRTLPTSSRAPFPDTLGPAPPPFPSLLPLPQAHYARGWAGHKGSLAALAQRQGQRRTLRWFSGLCVRAMEVILSAELPECLPPLLQAPPQVGRAALPGNTWGCGFPSALSLEKSRRQVRGWELEAGERMGAGRPSGGIRQCI